MSNGRSKERIYLYLLSGYNDGEMSYKIGLSNNVSRRLKELKTANPSIQLMKKVDVTKKYAFKIEKSLHNKYKYKNIGGEWFSLSSKDIETFSDDIKLIEESLIFLSESGNPFI